MQESEKLAQCVAMQIAEHLLLVPSVARERFFGQGMGTENIKFRFAPELPSIFINLKCSIRV